MAGWGSSVTVHDLPRAALGSVHADELFAVRGEIAGNHESGPRQQLTVRSGDEVSMNQVRGTASRGGEHHRAVSGRPRARHRRPRVGKESRFAAPRDIQQPELVRAQPAVRGGGHDLTAVSRRSQRPVPGLFAERAELASRAIDPDQPCAVAVGLIDHRPRSGCGEHRPGWQVGILDGVRDGVGIADEPSLRRVELLSEKRTFPREDDIPGIDPRGVRSDCRQGSRRSSRFSQPQLAGSVLQDGKVHQPAAGSGEGPVASQVAPGICCDRGC